MLDSLVLLWMLEDSHKLGPHTREMMNSAEDIAVSPISIAEIHAKSLIGRVSLAGDLLQAIKQSGVSELKLEWDDATTSGILLSPGGDLFNAIIIAQCKHANYQLLTADAVLLKLYPEITIDARP
jgi:PIN domain nuclease of toxin-antitoxin system